MYGLNINQTRETKSGFTLVELVVVMAIMAILTGFVGNVIFYEINTYNLVTARKEGMQNTRFAMQLIARDIRQIVSSDSIFKAEADSIRFRHVNGNQVKYQHINSNIYRNGDILLENLSGFAFSYHDGNGIVLPFPINDHSKIRNISFGLNTLTNGQKLRSQVSVTPRNF